MSATRNFCWVTGTILRRGRDAAGSRMSKLHMDLILFDIDGTLVRRAGPHHRLALVHAVRTVAGVDATTDGIPVQGMLDRDILSIMMRAAGFTSAAARRHMPEVVRQAQAVYPESCPDLR